jgi:glutamate synthase domain-containing protein 1
MFINNFSKRERRLALATLSVVSIAVIYILIVKPVMTSWKSFNNEIRSKLTMIEKDFKILANQKTIEAEYNKLSKYAKSGKSDEEAIADTLTNIENISRNNSCLIVNIKPVGITKAPSSKEILIEVNAEANIEQFAKFLYDIENPRDVLMNIKRFTISSKSTQTGVLKGVFLISKVILG